MTHVVVGVFEDMGKVAQVKQELKSAGFPESDVTVKSQQDISSASTAGSGEGRDREEGRIAHFFRSLFGLESDNEHTSVYSEAVRRNNVVVTVRADDDDRADRAEDILERCGAIDVDERSSQWRGDGWTPPATSASGPTGGGAGTYAPRTTGQTVKGGYEAMSGGTAGTTAGSPTGPTSGAVGDTPPRTAATDSRKIPVVEEELQVGKREVGRGGVRVFSRVTETPVEESVQLRQERATVTRRPVDRSASQEDLAAFKEDSIEVRETAEEPVVSKRARVVEEVEVGKETSQRQETVRDTVRRTDVEVEQLAGSDHEADFREHWTSTFADSGSRYDEYAPAYRYGSTLAGSDRYTGRTWDEIEPEARSDWETRYPGNAWERFKESVRYGWEKLTGTADAMATRANQPRGRSQPGRTNA